MNNLKKFTSLIVGCGNIAGKYDELNKINNGSFTHAGAYKSHPGFKLSACVESDSERKSIFQNYWEVENSYNSIDEIVANKFFFDVISICTPSEIHFQHLSRLLDLKPKLIFIEKPISLSINDSEIAVEKCLSYNVELAVNYTRRWAPDLTKLKVQLNSGKWGEIRSIVGHYNKGLLNNGSHMIDLLYYLFEDLSIVAVGNEVIDYKNTDPSIPVLLETSNGINAYLNIGNAKDYLFFELQIFCSKGVISMNDGGLSWTSRKVNESDEFIGQRSLGEFKVHKGHYKEAMYRAIDNIYNHLMSRQPLLSNAQSALKTERLIHSIRNI